MKKFLSLLLVALMIVPFGILGATGVSAAETTLYVKAGGNGNGSSEAQAIGSYDNALQVAAQLNTDVKIVICGTVELDVQASYYEPDHAKKFTLTGKDASAKLNLLTADKQAYYMNGPITLDNLTIGVPTNWLLQIITHYHDFVVEEGVSYVHDDGTPHYTTVRANISTTTIGWDEEKSAYTKDATMTLKSGTYNDICYFNSTSKVGNSIGTFTVNVSGDTVINTITTQRGGNSNVKSATYNLDGGVINRFIGAADRPVGNFTDVQQPGVTDTFTINITKNFDPSKSFVGQVSNATTWFGISGTTCAAVLGDLLLENANYVLKVAPEVFDGVKPLIQPDTFDEVYKGDEKVEIKVEEPEPPAADTSKPSDTQKPSTTTKPSTTNKPQTTTAATGTSATTAAPAADAEGSFPIWIVAVVAGAVVVAVVVVIIIKKKKQ